MADFVIHVGSCSAQGKRPNNEDRLVCDLQKHVFLVADGMGGQDSGERASGLAAEIIPRVVGARLAANQDAGKAVIDALAEAHAAIVREGQQQHSSRRMGTTAVVAVEAKDQVYVAGIGDSPAILIRGSKVEQLTVDHTVADALVRSGTITPDQAKSSPWKNVLYKFLGCAEMTDGAEVRPLVPKAGDRLVLASDGLSGHVTPEELVNSARQFPDAQKLADYLVNRALDSGSKDNVTCVVVAFDAV